MKIWADVGIVKKFGAKARRGGEGTHDDRKHAGDVGVGLLKGDARLEAGEALLAEIAEGGFAAVPLEGENDGGILKIEEVEFGGHDTDDLVRSAVQQDVLTEDGGRSGELLLPEAVGDHNGIGRAGRIVLTGEGAAEQRGNAKEGKGAVGDVERVDALRLCDTGQGDAAAAINANVLEALVLLAIDEVIGGGHVEVVDADSGSGVPDGDEFVRFGVGERLEEYALEDAEDDGVAANAGGESDERDHGEERRFEEAA